jgi:pimeloyl-ACP methyl ester carboxylesterase
MTSQAAHRAPWRERVVPFTAGDGLQSSLLNVRSDAEPTRGPIILVHGAGSRANTFRAPVRTSIVDYLVERGYDVWLHTWRGSSDMPPMQWDLDQAAVFDHAPAVHTILRETGAERLKALIHCQGSTSFMMSAVAGLVPEVDTIVATACSLHTIVPRGSELKLRYLRPMAKIITPYLNPQWGDDAPTVPAKLIQAWVRLTQSGCDNDVCKQVSFTYGSGAPALWRHENISDATHDWLRGEFKHVPFSFFDQMAECVRRGHLVSLGKHRELPADYVSQPPQTDARIALITGEHNRCFLPESQVKTFEYLERLRKGHHALHVIPGYSHIDIYMGDRAVDDVFPLIFNELERPGAARSGRSGLTSSAGASRGAAAVPSA